MILKRLDKKGNKYYIDRFTGRRIIITHSDPLKKEANPLLIRLMSERISLEARMDRRAKKIQTQHSAFMGNYKRLMRMKPEARNRREFILACKRVNVNPWPLMNVCAIQNK